MSILKHIVPRFVLRPYRDLQRRLDRAELSVRCLEMAVDALVVSPRYVPGDDIGFNGQLQRKRIFGDVTTAMPFDAIVETGTWLGNTTGYMSQTARRTIYSCELSPRFHALAKMRLAGLEQVQLELGDSRQFLQRLARSNVAHKSVLFYLDAHWYDDLPLGEEMEIIATGWREFVVMIDDFQVPDDLDYGYDDYGHGKKLSLDLLKPALAKHELAAFFPAAPGCQETGTKRGCVVLARKGEASKKLSGLASLRQWVDR
jgi:hypothetical protein